MLLTNHARQRLAVHGIVGDALIDSALRTSEPLDRELVAAVTAQPRRATSQDEYRLLVVNSDDPHAPVLGGILVIANGTQVVTYLRLNRSQLDVLYSRPAAVVAPAPAPTSTDDVSLLRHTLAPMLGQQMATKVTAYLRSELEWDELAALVKGGSAVWRREDSAPQDKQVTYIAEFASDYCTVTVTTTTDGLSAKSKVRRRRK